MVALKEVEKLMGKAIPQERLDGYAPAVVAKQKGARKNPNEHKNADGAFGKKKKTAGVAPQSKKRKTTKRDAYKRFDAEQPKAEKKDTRRSRKEK
jgi:hypothetical protein